MQQSMRPGAHYGFLQLFRSGTHGTWRNQNVTVSHVQISRANLLVYLQGRSDPVPAEEIQVAPSALTGPATAIKQAR